MNKKIKNQNAKIKMTNQILKLIGVAEGAEFAYWRFLHCHFAF
jgi:hypothetical protein